MALEFPKTRFVEVFVVRVALEKKPLMARRGGHGERHGESPGRTMHNGCFTRRVGVGSRSNAASATCKHASVNLEPRFLGMTLHSVLPDLRGSFEIALKISG